MLGRVHRVAVRGLGHVVHAHADALARAVVRAHGALARGPRAVRQALALARLAVAEAGVRALLLVLVRLAVEWAAA